MHTGRVHARPIAPRLFELMADGRLRPERVAGRRVARGDADRRAADHRDKLVVTRG
jgi:hypothetical protein